MVKRQTNGTSEAIAERLLQLRTDARLSRARLADQCAAQGAAWVTAKVINDIEKGNSDGVRRPVTCDELVVLARIFDRDLCWLLLGDPRPGQTDAAGLAAAVLDAVQHWRQRSGPQGQRPREWRRVPPAGPMAYWRRDLADGSSIFVWYQHDEGRHTWRHIGPDPVTGIVDPESTTRRIHESPATYVDPRQARKAADEYIETQQPTT